MTAVIVVLILTLVVVPCILALPTITINVPAVLDSSAYSYIRAGFYFLPVNTVAAILTITLALFLFRLLIAVVKAVWELLPFV